MHANNEMCATYAADGYGRTSAQTVGCVAFTYGVGTLNAPQSQTSCRLNFPADDPHRSDKSKCKTQDIHRNS